jgi:topoisomerase-4 subunit A
MLYRLTGLEIKAFEKEYKELEKEIKRLKRILESERELLKVIKEEMLEVSEKYGDDRRTKIVENDEEAKIDVEELIVEEDIMITMSNEGFTKRVPMKSYNRSNTDISDIEYREGDFNRFLLQSNTKDTMIIFTDSGNMYQTRAQNIPEYKWKDKGEKADTFIRGLDLNEEKIVAVYTIPSFISQLDFIFITDRGYIKKTGLDKYNTNYTKIMALKLKDNEKLISVNLVSKERQEEFIYIETKLGLSFTIEEPSIESLDRNIIGTEMFTVSNEDSVVNAEFRNAGEFKRFIINVDNSGIVKNLQNKTTRGTSLQIDYCTKVLVFTENGTVSAIDGFILQNMGDQGIDINLLINNNPKNKIVSIFTVENWEEKAYVYFFTKRGMVKKTDLTEFKNINLNTSAYKNKYENDSLINVQPALEKDHSSILLITKKGMVIRFNEDNVNPMGKIASGVTGISLKEDDEVIFGTLVNDTTKENKIVLKSKHNNEKIILIEDIKIQNRAGRGNSAMLIVMDDYIMKIKMER